MPEDDKPAPHKARKLGLDALRGIAVFLMIEQHVGVWLWQGPGPGETMGKNYPGLLAFNALGGGAAPLFITLAGMGSALLAHSRFKKGESPDRTMLLRGLALMGFGYLLSFLTPSWFSMRSWFVLHLMGFGMALGPVWRRLPTWTLLLVAVAVLAAAPVLQQWLDTPLHINNARMAAWANAERTEVFPGGHLRMGTVEGHFPIFPWLAFFLLGTASGRWVAEGRLRPIAVSGLVCLAAGAAMALVFHEGGDAAFKAITGSTAPNLKIGLIRKAPEALLFARVFRINVPFYPSTPSFVLLLAGGIFLGVSGVLALEQRREFREHNPLVTLGRISLTLLVFHVVAFREWSREVFKIRGTELEIPGYGWWHNLSAPGTLGVILGFVAIAAFVSVLWQRAEYRYGAEWVLRKVAP